MSEARAAPHRETCPACGAENTNIWNGTVVGRVYRGASRLFCDRICNANR